VPKCPVRSSISSAPLQSSASDSLRNSPPHESFASSPNPSLANNVANPSLIRFGHCQKLPKDLFHIFIFIVQISPSILHFPSMVDKCPLIQIDQLLAWGSWALPGLWVTRFELIILPAKARTFPCYGGRRQWRARR
jgi:hypothetical protein